MKDLIVLRVVTKFCLPFIMLFGFYVQFHGKYSPGGGFQAGVIIAAAFILYALIYSSSATLKVFPLHWMKRLAALGVLIYCGTGLLTMAMGGEFLNYSVLLPKATDGQYYGILAIELGVGLTVCNVMLLLFFTFALYPRDGVIDNPKDEDS